MSFKLRYEIIRIEITTPWGEHRHKTFRIPERTVTPKTDSNYKRFFEYIRMMHWIKTALTQR